MLDIGIIGLFLIIINIVVSYKGIKDVSFFNRYKFEIDKILINRELIRLMSSGFLHVGWMHLILNLLCLYLFSELIENKLGSLNFIFIYFSSLIAGNLFALLVHRNHGDYSAVGASGAVSGVVFAAIALYPSLEIGFWGLPFSIPGWLFGLLYVLYSIYGIKSQKDNIGHEAHLGGAFVGMLCAIITLPEILKTNYLTILIISIPTLIFIVLIIKKPHLLLIDNVFYKKQYKNLNIDQKFNENKVKKQKEIDIILDKINKKGIESLSKKEMQILNDFSK